MTVSAQESTGMGMTLLGTLAAWVLSNPGEFVGAACAILGLVLMILKYFEERPKRIADSKLAKLRLKQAMEGENG